MEVKNKNALQTPMKTLKKESCGFATPTYKVDKMPTKPPTVRKQVGSKGGFVSFSDLASMKDRFEGVIRTQTHERKPGRRQRKTRKKPATTPNKISFLSSSSPHHGISSFHSFSVTQETNHQLQQIMRENKDFVNRKQGGVAVKPARTPPSYGAGRKQSLSFSGGSALRRPQVSLQRQLHKKAAPKSAVLSSRVMKRPRGKFRPNILRNARVRRTPRRSPKKQHKLLKKLKNSPRKALDFSPSKFFNQSKSSLLNSSTDSKSSQSHVKSLFKESFEEDGGGKCKEFNHHEFVKFGDSGICLPAQDDADDFEIHEQNSMINPSLTSTPISEKRNKSKTRLDGVQPFSFQIENIPFERALNDSAHDIEMLLDPANGTLGAAEQKTEQNHVYRMMDCSLLSTTADESSGLLATMEEDNNFAGSQSTADNTGHDLSELPADLNDCNMQFGLNDFSDLDAVFALDGNLDLSGDMVSESQKTGHDSMSFFSEEIDPFLSSSCHEPVMINKLTLGEPTPAKSSSVVSNENFMRGLVYEQREIKKSQHITLLGDAGNTTPHHSPVKSPPARIKLTARFMEMACGCSEDQKQMTRAARNFIEMNPRVQAV